MSRHVLCLISGAARVAVSVIAPAAPSYPSPTDPAVSIGDVATVDGTAHASLDHRAPSATLTFNKSDQDLGCSHD